MADRRKGRLHHYFRTVLTGKEKITSTIQAKRFIEAICSKDDTAACVASLVASMEGQNELQKAVRIDTTIAFANTSINDLLTYLQSTNIASACGGGLLRKLLHTLVEPPIFWDNFATHAESRLLTPDALHGFAWMLLQMVSDPDQDVSEMVRYVKRPGVEQVLLAAPSSSTRNLVQKILHVVANLENTTAACSNGPGGRHDNDHTDFRDIAIIPTIDELVCKDEPFLRFASTIDAVEPETRLAALLDNQFRLLREDFLRDLREDIIERSKRLTIHGLNMVDISSDQRRPWSLTFECSNGIPFVKGKNANEREKYLQDHKKILSNDALVSIFVDGRLTGLATIWRRENDLARDLPILHLRLAGGNTAIHRTLQSLRKCSQIAITQLSTAFFAYAPVLKQLQISRSIPLADQIVRWSVHESMSAAEGSDRLQNLVKAMVADPSMDLQDKLSLNESVSLDNNQAQSFLAALTQSIALIQGPPGTGKSFIGALIAKAFLQHTDSKILLLSYTNHSADQLPTDLLDLDVNHDQIVRLGSITKASERTKPLMLSEQQSRLQQSDWEVINSHQATATLRRAELRTAFEDYRKEFLKPHELMEYLEFSSKFQDFFEAFQMPLQSEFTLVNKDGKEAGSFYLLECWCKNQRPRGLDDTIQVFQEIWSLQQSERDSLRQIWRDDILAERIQRLTELGSQYDALITNIDDVFNEKNRRVLCEKRIIACTTTGAAKNAKIINAVQPEIVIVEEAGEILESHILTALGPFTKRLILIGDHKQLRPKANFHLSVEKGTGYDLNRSLFERLILKNYPHTSLLKQHRMRPEISNLVRQLTYSDLLDAPTTQNRPTLKGFQDSVIFVNHEHAEDSVGEIFDAREGGRTSSKTNYFEGEMTLKCVRYLAQQGYGSDQIVVLTPYLGQLRLLYDILKKENDPVLNDIDMHDLVRAGLVPQAVGKITNRRLRISTIDNYQGEECDVVVASMTRSNSKFDIGFMQAPERLNVLLSRARNGMILLGNMETYLHARKGGHLWTKFFKMMQDAGHIYDGFPLQCAKHPNKKTIVSSPKEFDTVAPDGGCDAPCGVLLNCKIHNCPQKCHQIWDHSKMQCEKTLTAQCPKGHTIWFKCFTQGPGPCKTCEATDKRAEAVKKRAEAKKQSEYHRLSQEAERQVQHEDRMAKLDAEIEIEKQRKESMKLEADRSRAYQQKQVDLTNIKVTRSSGYTSATYSQASQPLAPDVSKQNLNQPQHIEKKIAPKATATSTQSRSNTSGNGHVDTSTPENPSKNAQNSLHITLPQSRAAQDWDYMKKVEGIVNKSMDELMQMTGLEEVKQHFLTILQKLQTVQRQGLDLKQERLGSVFQGNPGTGKTTVARLYGKFLSEIGATDDGKFIETSGAKLASDGINAVKKMVEDLLANGGGTIFVDEAYQLVSAGSFGGKAVLDYLLTEIENQVGKIIFIFAGYVKEMEAFFQHNPGLPSRLPNQMKFLDYTSKELMLMFCQKIKKKWNNRMKVEDNYGGLYMRIVIQRLCQLRGQEGFGNARALENILQRIASAQSKRLAQQRREGLKPDDFILTKEDLIGPEPSEAFRNCQAWVDLKNMVGLEAIKISIQTLIDRLKDNYQRELIEKLPVKTSLNRLFLGPPGTGKTTVARLYAQILADIGVLSTSECVLKTPSDFIGNVIGDSEVRTKAILESTKGKVLVIDEAYMLASGTGPNAIADPYRTAVVDTIVAEVQSTPGEDRAVLLLGYQEQMESMLRSVNPGLKRRFPLENAFVFENYDDEQLLAILDHKLKVQNLGASQEAKQTAINILAKLRRQPNFGNAGEVENLLSRGKDAFSKRQQNLPADQRSFDIVFEPVDFDPNHGKSSDATINCSELFKDVVGADAIVDKLTGIQKAYINAPKFGLDPTTVVPFNFVFKGPPGRQSHLCSTQVKLTMIRHRENYDSPQIWGCLS